MKYNDICVGYVDGISFVSLVDNLFNVHIILRQVQSVSEAEFLTKWYQDKCGSDVGTTEKQ